MSELNRIKNRLDNIYKTPGDQIDAQQLISDVRFLLEEHARIRRVLSERSSLILALKHGRISKEDFIKKAGFDYQ